MPSLSPVLTVAPTPVASAVSTETAPALDSGGSFQDALSSALDAGNAVSATEPALPEAKDQAIDAASIAVPPVASGNVLPLAVSPAVSAELLLALLPPAPAAPDAKSVSANEALTETRPAEAGLVPVLAGAVGREGAAVKLMPMLSKTEARPDDASFVDVPTTGFLSGEMARSALAEQATRNEGGAEQFKQAVAASVAQLAGADAGAAVSFSSLLPPANTAAVSVLDATNTVSSTVSVPVGQASWGQAFSQQVVWSVNQNVSAAELHLSPPDLGPVSVRISMDHDQGEASISFGAAHGSVREAIEAALPRLRDMLSTQGIALTDVNVSTQGQFQQAQRDAQASRVSGAGGPGDEPVAVPEAPVVQRSWRLLDTYA